MSVCTYLSDQHIVGHIHFDNISSLQGTLGLMCRHSDRRFQLKYCYVKGIYLA